MTRLFLISLATLFLVTGCSESQRSAAKISKGRFSISLAVFKGFDGRAQAERLQMRATEILNCNDIWIETLSNGLSVNVGHYKTLVKAKNGLTKIKPHYTQLQLGMYQFAYAKEVPVPNPPAPPEWEITYNNCDYSLQVAIYYNVPESKYFSRKKDAVAAVKTLRDSGSPAYFYHGYHETRVMVGCISKNAAPAIVKILRNKHPWHYENSYRVYQVMKDSQQNKVRLQSKSFFVNLDEIIE